MTASADASGGGHVHTTGGATAPGSAAAYPDPRLEPWPGFALAAEAGVGLLADQVGMDLWLVTHREGEEAVVVASAGPWEALLPPGTRVAWASAFCSRMVDRTGPVCAPDVRDVPAYAPLASGIFTRVRSYVGVPLEGDAGRFFGTLSAVSGTRQPESLDACMPVVQAVARLLSTVVAREQVAQERSADEAAAYALAQHDQLTDLCNRRGWVTALEREQTRCRRYGSAASVLVLDLDDLKRVNDAGGHEIGRAHV